MSGIFTWHFFLINFGEMSGIILLKNVRYKYLTFFSEKMSGMISLKNVRYTMKYSRFLMFYFDLFYFLISFKQYCTCMHPVGLNAFPTLPKPNSNQHRNLAWVLDIFMNQCIFPRKCQVVTWHFFREKCQVFQP